MINMPYKTMFFILSIIFCSGIGAQEKGVFIVNKDVGIETLSKAEIKKIYLGKMKLWKSRVKVRPCYLHEKKKLSKNFFKKILSMAASDFNKHWRKQLFAGYGTPPKKFTSVDDILDFVSRKEGAIGFIPASMLQNAKNCKAIKVGGKANF